jgi:hypothetical protein
VCELTVQSVDKELSVFRYFKGSDGGSEDLDAESLQDTHLVELNTNVQGGLTTKGEEDPIWAFLFENVRDIIGGDGEEVDFVCEVVGGLDGSDVGVDEDGGDVALSECLDGLRTCR